MPDYYSTTHDRKTKIDSRDISDLLKQPNNVFALVSCVASALVILTVIIVIVALAGGFAGGFLYRKKVSEKEISSAEEEGRRIVNEAIRNAESKKKEALLEVLANCFNPASVTRAVRAIGCRASDACALREKTAHRVPVIWSVLHRINEMKYEIWVSVPARLPPMTG